MTDDETPPSVGLEGTWVCWKCERVLRENRDEFVLRSEPKWDGLRAFCDGHADAATDGLGRHAEVSR